MAKLLILQRGKAMARRPRLLIKDGLYHVTSRGDRQELVYEDDGDRKTFLRIVGQGMLRFAANAHAYCLMGNHYHLLVQTPGANLSQLMRHINGVYTQAFNRKHARVGHVFQGRFHASLVDRDAYLLEACRYVDLNPVRAGLVKDAGAWHWSSYRAHVGLANRPPWLDSSMLHASFFTQRPMEDGPLRYQRFVAEGLSQADLPADLIVRPSAASAVEEPAWTRSTQSARPELNWYFQTIANRDEAIHAAHVEGAYSIGEIAQARGLSVSRISQIVKQISAGTSVR
jgi:putative transposase